jgi:hypothetical protein
MKVKGHNRAYYSLRVRWPHSGLTQGLPGALLDALDQARIANRHRAENWPDPETPTEKEGLLWKILMAFGPCEAGNVVHQQLAWLSFFAARRSLSCWELYCDGHEPHVAVEAVAGWLKRGKVPTDWEPLCSPAAPSFQGKSIIDCRAGDTGCASAAAAYAVRFVRSADPVAALRAIGCAYVAFDMSPFKVVDDDFLSWLIEVAVPVAYHRREMTLREQNVFRSYEPGGIPQERERYAPFWNQGLR